MSKTPKLRFKEFSGDWEKKKLGTVTLLVKDGTHGTHADVEQGPYLLSAKNIKDGKIVITNEDRKISYEDYNSIYKNYSLQENDILLSIVGTIGRCAVMPKIKDIAFQRSVAILRFNLNANYVYQYMNTKLFQNQLLRKQVVSAQPGIYLNDLKNLDMSFPSIEEQEKIASFFSLIDDKISLQGEKVEALKDYKTGMMQKIFSRELRFKDDEGRDYPEWEEKKLGNLIYEPTKVKEEEPEKQELLTVKLHCLGIEATGKRPNSTKNGRPYYKRFKGELLIGRQNMHNGGMGIVDDKCNGLIASNAISSYISKEDVSIDFIYYTISRADYYKRIDLLIGGTGQKEISKKELENLVINIPCLEEQIKIVEFLNKVDIKLEKEQEKLDSLNEYKKGLLQQMFV